MRKLTLTLIILISMVTNNICQVQILSGLVVEKDTEQTITGTHIILANGKTTISDSLGRFTIPVEKLPIVISISHLSYGLTEFTINQISNRLFVFKIQRVVNDLEEVQISAEKLRILTEKDDFSLQDIAIDSTNLWMLGYINNRDKYGRLWLANLFGDTLHSIPVKKPEKLYRDVFGNIHLFYEDSVYQLSGTPDTIVLFPGLSKMDFQRIISPIKGYFAGKLICQKYLPLQEGLHTYYYSQTDTTPKYLTYVRDTAGEILQEDEYVYGYCASIMNSLHGMAGNGLLAIWLAMVKRDQNKHLVMNRCINTPIISTNNNLFILNKYKDSLLVYDKAGGFVNHIPITFHKDLEVFQGIHYKNIDFIYPEKKYPFYSRLYRFQL